MLEINVTDREGRQHRIESKPLFTLMEVLRDNDLDIEAICGGTCACATCHVLIAPEWAAKLTPPSHEEMTLVSESVGYDAHRSRLSCQVTLRNELNGLVLTVAPQD